MHEFEDIVETVATYVQGMARGDALALQRAFHPRAASIGYFEGALEWAGIEEFIQACQDEAIAEDAQVPPHEIESIAVAGDTAMVRVTNVWAGLKFRDSLTLLRHDGRWQIVSKAFVHLP